MRKSIIFIFIAVIFCSCKPVPAPIFDLSAIKFTETVGQALKGSGLTAQDGKSKAFTATKYRVFESTDPRILIFNGVLLAGKSNDSVNKVIIHYSVKDSAVSMIEIKVFSAEQIKTLENALDKKLGKAPYPSDAYTTVFSDNVRFYNRVWADAKTTVGHFYTNTLNKQKQQEARLAILNYSDSTISEVAYLKGYSSSTIESDVKNALSNSTATNKNK
ncbi:hypothetical protein [Pedobacter sp. L105]|uniref:hypothetical protein n=1 Tax=Pedobacter sp. L105 TaxID=1641871 RepID=UPI00131CD571|nr:hypothetical protein [Pedobacter sp. L105]